MSLKDLKLKCAYNSDEDNLLEDFYIPVLSESTSYRRIAGYFSSNALAIASKGIAKLINNGGKIKLIANVVLTEEDQEAIKSALLKKEDELLAEINELEDGLKRNHIRMLSWMLRKDLLEIKIAVVPRGIEHIKKGIFEDKDGNKISFSGSDNETLSGWIRNHEDFHVFASWQAGEHDHLLVDIEGFERLWGNIANRVKVFDVSDAFRSGLIRTAPRDEEEFTILSVESTNVLLDKNRNYYTKNRKSIGNRYLEELWYFQKDALHNWEKEGFCGIISMATGTGKTKTAIAGLVQLKGKKTNGLFTIICCPQFSILKQWEKEIKELNLFQHSITADSTNINWTSQLADKIMDYNNHLISDCVIFTTYNTLSNNRFIDSLSKLKGESLIICDEVHWAGAGTFRNGLLETYNYRLGLSATPERHMDEGGTDLIKTYFKGVVFEFPLEKALSEINPITKETFLCPYNYYPIFIELKEAELVEYLELTGKINRQFAVERQSDDTNDYLQRLLEKRQAIIRNASGKYDALIKIINELEEIKYLLIYCSPEQIDNVQQLINYRNIINHRFTGREGINPRKEYHNLSERENILSNFENGIYQALIAMRCLDEGVNIIRAETAILMASSRNPKEYIQRRGRLLRRHKEKHMANIYDIIVLPYLKKSLAANVSDDEMKIVKKEFIRYEEFANLASNTVEALNGIYEIMKLYNFKG